VTKNLYVGDGFASGKVRELASSMRSVRGSDVHDDPVKTKSLFDAVKTDSVESGSPRTATTTCSVRPSGR
jgi:hypothetical protein